MYNLSCYRLVRNWWAKVAAHMLVFSVKFCWVSVPTVLCLGAHWRLFCVTFFRSCTTNLSIALSLQFFYWWSSSVGIQSPLSSGMCKILPSGASSWVKSIANYKFSKILTICMESVTEILHALWKKKQLTLTIFVGYLSCTRVLLQFLFLEVLLITFLP